jgi:RimJ/RimL family protein N-acetyltransferase
MTETLIEDATIRLRALCSDDAGAHLAGCDRVIIDRLGGGSQPTPDEVSRWLRQNAQAWVNGGEVFDLGIEDRQSGLLAGCVGIQRGLDYLSAGQVNLTYALYPQWRVRGLATRAVRLAMEIGRRRGPVSEFVIRVATDNPESSRVAARAGFRVAPTTDDDHGHLLWHVAPASTEYTPRSSL